jgi:hypothetical protein
MSSTPKTKWIVGVTGFLASILGIAIWLTGVPSLPDLLGRRRGVPLESTRLLALMEDCSQRFGGWCTTGNIQPVLRAGANPNVRNDAGVPVLALAMFSNVEPAVISLLVDSGADVNAVDNSGRTCLISAEECQGSHAPQYVGILLRAGAQVNVPDRQGWTPLMFAAYHHNIAFARTMLASGADPNMRNCDGRTAFDIAEKEYRSLQAKGYFDLATPLSPLIAELRRITLATSAHAEEGSDRPPVPFIAHNVCPGEGCNFGSRITQLRLDVFEREGDASRVTFTLQPYETYEALRGDVYVTRPGIVEVTKPVFHDSSSEPLFQPGNTVYVLTQYGEGFVDVWYKGHVHHITDFWAMPGDKPGDFKGILRQAPQSTWWVYIRSASGDYGWIRQ